MPLIAIDNTNIKIWEFENYIQMAKEYQYKVRVIRIIGDPEVSARRNIHNVPIEGVLKMYKNIETYEDNVIQSSEMDIS